MNSILTIGDIAPVVGAEDIWENTIEVPSKRSWNYLSFHRFANCPFCNLRTNELITNYNVFKEHKIEVVSIWPSSKPHLLRYSNSVKTPFPMLSNKDRSIYRAYGVTKSSIWGGAKLIFHPQLIVRALKGKSNTMEVDADPNLMPASFLISPKGIVQMAYYGKHFGDHPTIESIIQAKEQ